MADDVKLKKELKDSIDSIPIFDTHEHVLDEEDRRAKKLDFSLLFMMYAGTDLQTSGMSEEDFLFFQSEDTPVEKKWKTFSPYWDKIKNTNYSRVILRALKDLYGYEDITDANYLEVSDSIDGKKNTDFYEEVLRKSNIVKVLNHLENVWQARIKIVDRKEFAPLINLDDVISTCCMEDILSLEKRFKRNIYNLKDLLSSVDELFEIRSKSGFKGLKTAIAYMRPIIFEETTFSEADRVFSRLFKLKDYGFLEKKDFLSKDELKPLQDYLVHYFIQKATQYGLPVQIHTGIFELLRNDVSNSNPSYLCNLFIKYRDCDFDIFHAGYPYSDELIAICKQFPNVYFDLCWIADISKTLYKRILNLLIEIIPSTKIFGFGGDYMFIEGLYGSQRITRDALSELFYEKIKNGDMDFSQSMDIAEKILNKNPGEVYRWQD